MGDMTDSETALQKVIYPAIVKYGYGSEGMDVAVAKVIGYSKFAFMQGDDVRLYGDFITGDDGCYYSNLRFMPFVGWQRKYRHNAYDMGSLITTGRSFCPRFRFMNFVYYADHLHNQRSKTL